MLSVHKIFKSVISVCDYSKTNAGKRTNDLKCQKCLLPKKTTLNQLKPAECFVSEKD
jgi:hypothetical protein